MKTLKIKQLNTKREEKTDYREENIFKELNTQNTGRYKKKILKVKQKKLNIEWI